MPGCSGAALKEYFIVRISRPFFCVSVFISCVLTLQLYGCGLRPPSHKAAAASQPGTIDSKSALGERLFSDPNLSLQRTQSCATCHNPAHAFIDNRPDATGQIAAASLGDDGHSLGDRNTPTAMYARFSPAFGWASHPRFNSQQPDYEGFVGGQFVDGRENDLAGQASGPPVNPIEMGMPDKAAVVERLLENSRYVAAFQALYGQNIFADTEAAYAAMADSIARFEQTEVFAPFSARYDRSLAGGYQYDPLSRAANGKALFFSQQFTNCATCHQLQPNGHRQETFSNYEYHNIGVPVNARVREANGKGADFVDIGLLENPVVNSEEHRGKFKVPTLRNVGVTAPYMHNGVFQELRTVLQFYDHFLTDSSHVVNPETGVPWREPEVAGTLSLVELQDGRRLSDDDIEALYCFLLTLTDAQYEHLLKPEDVQSCGI